jgi:hypothetical protein
VLGAWTPTDPVTRAIWGTTSVAGQRVYDTTERDRGPDRIVVNFAPLRASADARLRRIFASDVELITGDCDTLKLAEKLAWIGEEASFFGDEFPGARPLRCVPIADLPDDATTGAVRIALVRSPEAVAAGRPAGTQRSGHRPRRVTPRSSTPRRQSAVVASCTRAAYPGLGSPHLSARLPDTVDAAQSP